MAEEWQINAGAPTHFFRKSSLNRNRPKAHIHRVESVDDLKNLVGKAIYYADGPKSRGHALYTGEIGLEEGEMIHRLLQRTRGGGLAVKLVSEKNMHFTGGCLIPEHGYGFKSQIHGKANPDFPKLDEEARRADYF